MQLGCHRGRGQRTAFGVCADVVEGLNTILKRAYKDHTGGGGGGATQVELEAQVVFQNWEW